MKLKFNRKNYSGFTLLELLIATALIIIGGLALFLLGVNIILASQASQAQFVAANLGAEAIEVIRNIRDTNWLSEADWRQNLADGDYLVEYNDEGADIVLIAGGTDTCDTPFLRLDNGFYNYTSGTPTFFHRKVSLSTGPDYLKVESSVCFKKRGKTSTIHLETWLYNWK